MNKQFEYYIENENFHLKYARGEPSLKEREFHQYHEFVYFLEGNTYFVSKNIQQSLSCGSLVIIPKEQFHQFFVENPSAYKRLILGFSESRETAGFFRETLSEVKIIDKPISKITDLFDNLIGIIKSELSDKEKELFINASLIQLLVYVKQYTSAEITENLNISPIVQKTLAYIDENYTRKISVESIAKQLYVSRSTLAHKFSNELNISIYQYISKKRVLSVNRLVEAGESYASAAIKSGFSDYSCFYRIYKKYYE